MTGLEALLAAYGLPVLTLGCLIEGDTVAALGGVLARRGTFGPVQAALAAATGGFLSDQAFFHAGRRLGHTPRMRRLLEGRSAVRLRGALIRHPDALILGCRFVAGVRMAGPAAMGASGLSAWRFAAVDLVAALIWGALLTAIGYGLGTGVGTLFGRLAFLPHVVLAGLAIAALAGAVLLLRRLLA